MSSLENQLKELKQDLVADPMRISAYHDLPFAIFLYPPDDEFFCRKSIRLLAVDLEQNHHKRITFISLGQLLWQAIEATEGLEALISEENQRGFENTQKTINTLITDPEYSPIYNLLAERLQNLDPQKDIVFIVRAGALAPAIYRGSALLDEMHGQTMVPLVLFYPGTAKGRTDIRFMGISERAGTGTYNYRVKIYGGS
jgi:hypothetical protein